MAGEIPVLPDLERRTTYSPVASAGPFDVGFDLYGDGTDYQNWLRVFLDGLELERGSQWALSSPTGAISTERARPIRDAQVTLATPATGQLVIVGEMRPRRTTQLTEGRGVSARDFNLLATRLMTVAREYFDRIWRLEDQVATKITDPTIAPNAVRVDVTQDFTPEQKALARANIDLSSGLPFNTVADLAAKHIPAVVMFIQTAGYYEVGDGGACRRARKPGPGPGNVQAADGSWWGVAESVVNVKMFGAVGDGVTDDTAAIQAGIDAGFDLLFPRGTYRCDSGLAMSVTGQRLYTDTRWGVTKNATISFSFSGGTGIAVQPNTVLDGLEIRGVSRAAGPAKLISASVAAGTQPDIDVIVRNCYLSGAGTLVYIKGRGLLAEYNTVEASDVCFDIEFPSDVGAATDFGNTVAGGARKYLFRNNYDHASSGAFVRVNGESKALVHGVHIINNYFDNASIAHALFDGHLNHGLIAGNTAHRLSGHAVILRGCRGAKITGNNFFGSTTDQAVSGFNPVIMQSAVSIPAGTAGPLDDLDFSNNIVAYSRRPMIAVGSSMGTLKVDGNTLVKGLLDNSDGGGRSDGVIDIAAGVTVGALLARNNAAVIDNLTGNAAAGFVKNAGTVSMLSWANNTVNADAGLPLAAGVTITQTLDGDLLANGHDIRFTNGTGVKDDAGNGLLLFLKVANAINSVTLANAVAGAAPKIAAEGGDANVVLELAGKGSAPVYVSSRLVQGTSSQTVVYGGGITPDLQRNGTTATGIGQSRWANNTAASNMSLAKSRGAAVGTRGIVVSGDQLGNIWFDGDDGVKFVNAVRIWAEVDGAPGVDDMPGRLLFGTTPDGGAAPVERMRIDNKGNVVVGTAALATTATDGFLYLPTCAGTPTGTPAAYAGRVPIVFDSTNGKLCVYSGSAWIALN